MSKQKWKPGNMLYPLPAVLVSCGDREGKINLMTAAWTGTVCSDPPMVYVSVRKERFSHHMIQETGEYVINLTTEELARATDFCGVRSGKDMDKFKEMHLTPAFGELQYAPMIVIWMKREHFILKSHTRLSIPMDSTMVLENIWAVLVML